MYSLVMMAALTAGPDVPQHWMCPVTPSNYGCGFWSKFSFYDCCAPARYGWVDCWNKGFSYYPGACPSNFGSFYQTQLVVRRARTEWRPARVERASTTGVGTAGQSAINLRTTPQFAVARRASALRPMPITPRGTRAVGTDNSRSIPA